MTAEQKKKLKNVKNNEMDYSQYHFATFCTLVPGFLRVISAFSVFWSQNSDSFLGSEGKSRKSGQLRT